jgi:hypothetical protein
MIKVMKNFTHACVSIVACVLGICVANRTSSPPIFITDAHIRHYGHSFSVDHLSAYLFTHFSGLVYINRAEKIANNETVFPPKHVTGWLRMLCSGVSCSLLDRNYSVLKRPAVLLYLENGDSIVLWNSAA